MIEETMKQMLIVISILCSVIFISAEPVVQSVEGAAGTQVPVYKKTVGNQWGYFEFLPESFTETSTGLGIVFYFNGANTGSGTGDNTSSGLPEMLQQGLPKEIKNGLHPEQIVISTQVGAFGFFNDPDEIYVVDNYISFIVEKYSPYIDTNKITFTGFSQGAGSVVKYAQSYPHKVAAVFPVAQGFNVNYKNSSGVYPNQEAGRKLIDTPTWFFHHKEDGQIQSKLSSNYYDFLIDLNDTPELHKLTIYEQSTSASKSHDVTNWAYADEQLWAWVAKQSLSNESTATIKTQTTQTPLLIRANANNVEFDRPLSGTFSLYNSAGRKLTEKSFTHTESVSLTNTFSQGCYFAVVTTLTGVVHSQRLVF